MANILDFYNRNKLYYIQNKVEKLFEFSLRR